MHIKYYFRYKIVNFLLLIIPPYQTKKNNLPRVIALDNNYFIYITLNSYHKIREKTSYFSINQLKIL